MFSLGIFTTEKDLPLRNRVTSGARAAPRASASASRPMSSAIQLGRPSQENWKVGAPMLSRMIDSSFPATDGVPVAVMVAVAVGPKLWLPSGPRLTDSCASAWHGAWTVRLPSPLIVTPPAPSGPMVAPIVPETMCQLNESFGPAGSCVLMPASTSAASAPKNSLPVGQANGLGTSAAAVPRAENARAYPCWITGTGALTVSESYCRTGIVNGLSTFALTQSSSVSIRPLLMMLV